MGDAEAQPAPAAVDAELFYIRSTVQGRLWQCEILQNVPQVRLSFSSIGSDGELEVDTDPHPLVIVLSQDCDLQQDFQENSSGGSILPNILMCDLFDAEQLRSKVRDTENIASKDWKQIKQNKNERFQFLHPVKPEEDLKSEGLAALAIDFRLYFTMRTEEVYRRLLHGTLRRCRLATPYAEHLVDRFNHYLARIPLPREH